MQVAQVRTQCNWHLSAQFAGWMVAAERGIYRRFGVISELLAGAQRRTELDVAGGRAELGLSGTLLRCRRQRPGDVGLTVIAAQYPTAPVGLLTVGGGRSMSLKDLGRLRVGVPANAIELEAIDHDRSWREVRVTDGVQELLTGSIDVLWAYAPNQVLELERLSVVHRFTGLDELGSRQPGGVLFARTDFLGRHRDTVVRCLAGTLLGWKAVSLDPEHAGTVVSAVTGIDSSDASGRCRRQVSLMGSFEDRTLLAVPSSDDGSGVDVDGSLLAEAYELIVSTG